MNMKYRNDAAKLFLYYVILLATGQWLLQFVGNFDEFLMYFAALPACLAVLLTRRKRGRSNWSGRQLRSVVTTEAESDVGFYQRQLADLPKVDRVWKKCALNDEEKEVFEAALLAIKSGRWRYPLFVHAQVCMGSFIDVRPISHRKLVNSKRVDFLITDRHGNVRLAVEHQGSGHEIEAEDVLRNQVKQWALARAGVPLVETRSVTDAQQTIKAALDLHVPTR